MSANQLEQSASISVMFANHQRERGGARLPSGRSLCANKAMQLKLVDKGCGPRGLWLDLKRRFFAAPSDERSRIDCNI